jgi:exopolysaccharide production protein ExoZ
MMGWIANQFELSRGGAGQNVLPMEGLRGFAVFLVFLVHYATLMGPWITPNSGTDALAKTIHSIGNAGVDLFFVLSGYLIYGSLIARKKPFTAFMRKRIERIYPAFTCVFLLYAMLSFLSPADSKIPPGAYDGTLYLIQNFLLLPGLFPIEPMITVAWSLSYEMFYYLMIPATIMVFGLRERSSRWRVVFFFGLAMVIALYCATRGGPVRLNMFIAGILLHEALRARQIKSPPGMVAWLALAAGLAIISLPFNGSTPFAIKTMLLAATAASIAPTAHRHASSAGPRCVGSET